MLKDADVTPTVPEGYYSSWAQYTVLMKDAEQRSNVQAKLKEKGIPTKIYYPRGLHQQKAYAWMQLGDGDYCNTIEATKRVLSLPIHPYLPEEEQQFVTESLLEALR